MQSFILLHGAIGASDQLLPLETLLKEKGWNAFTFNFSGHGQTPFDPNGFNIPVFANELKEFISKNNLTKPNVFGYSMGGYVALYLASQYPELLGEIVTLGTKFAWTPEIAAKEIKMLNASTITEKVPKYAEALQKRHGTSWQELLNKTALMMIELGNNNVLASKELSKIKNKVLIGLADNDNMVSVAETDAVFDQLQSAQRFTLPNTKHPIESVNINELATILVDFYSSL